MTIHDILVPTDFSEPAQAAFAYAKALATEFGSRVHLLNVIATPQLAWSAEGGTYSWPELLTDFEREAGAELDRLAPADGPLAGRVTTATMIGSAVESILDYASTHQIDLIVMGTHGRGLMGHMLLGSVAERVVRWAPIPVLTMHRPPAPVAETIPVAALESAAG